jgi:cytochrome c556
MAQNVRVLAAIVGVLATAGAASPQSDPPAGPVAILDNSDTMELLVKPAYVELQRAMARTPVDRQMWAATYQAAARLAEIENLLFFRTRESARTPEWRAKVAGARQASADVAAAALLGLSTTRPEQADIVRSAYAAIAGTCNRCHRAFAREAPVIKP